MTNNITTSTSILSASIVSSTLRSVCTTCRAYIRQAADLDAMQRFYLLRQEDLTGVSGCGIVAEGVAFSDGRVVLAWRKSALDPHRPGAINHYTSIAELEAIHGHGGRTVMVWIDQANRCVKGTGKGYTGRMPAPSHHPLRLDSTSHRSA